jgi:hypothetical protein
LNKLAQDAHQGQITQWKNQNKVVGKDIERLRAFAMSCILLVMQSPWVVMKSNTMPFRLRHAPPKNQPVLSSSKEHLVHAGNKSGDLLFAVAQVTSLDKMQELKRC